jgi:cytochrome c
MKRNCILASIAALALAGSAGAAAAQGVEDGASYFSQHCQMCHTNTPGERNGVGPNLFGVGNRKAGSAANFSYTPALKSSKLVWTQKTLDKFLTMPGALVPGTMMVVSIPDAGQRQSLIAYLMTLKKK